MKHQAVASRVKNKPCSEAAEQSQGQTLALQGHKVDTDVRGGSYPLC